MSDNKPTNSPAVVDQAFIDAMLIPPSTWPQNNHEHISVLTLVPQDPRIEMAAKALAWRDLTPKGRVTFDWMQDFSEVERAAFRATAVVVMQAIEVI